MGCTRGPAARQRIRATAAVAGALLAVALPAASANDYEPATRVTSHEAVLSATVHGDGAPFTWRFEYGTTRKYGSATPDVSDPGSNDDKPVSATLTGLAPATTYHARLSWTIQGELQAGDDFNFTTPPEGSQAGLVREPGGDAGADPEDGRVVDTGGAAHPPHPKVGRSAATSVVAGAVRVRTPGAEGSAALPSRARIPVGSVLDTRRGTLRLTTALAGGRTQSATFRGGIFELRQAPALAGMTDVVLRTPSRRGCGAASAGARAAALTRRRPRELARLWGADKGGRYRTHGANSVATVRGTKWLTVERCDGTLTKVSEGSVSVFDRRLGRRVAVRAGHSYLARRA